MLIIFTDGLDEPIEDLLNAAEKLRNSGMVTLFYIYIYCLSDATVALHLIGCFYDSGKKIKTPLQNYFQFFIIL